MTETKDLRKRYNEEIVNTLMEKFGYKNRHQVK